MKARKISMTISALLFVAGLFSAFILSCRGLVSGDMGQLWLNLSIGLATGGLVALLIEFPLTYSVIGANKHLLTANGYYAYVHAETFVTLIDAACENEDMPIYEKFCEKSLTKIQQSLLPMIRLDKHMYFCRCKQKQVDSLIWGMHSFLMNADIIDNALKIKLNKLEIESLQKQIAANTHEERLQLGNSHKLTTQDVKAELIGIRSEILPLLNSIESTMNLVLNKRELAQWRKQLEDATATLQERKLAFQSK